MTITDPRIRKFTFTYDDIAKIKRVKRSAVINAASKGYLDPTDLGSITRYIHGDMLRDLKQTLKFWKKKAKGEK